MSKNNPIDELKQINNFLRFTSLSKEKKNISTHAGNRRSARYESRWLDDRERAHFEGSLALCFAILNERLGRFTVCRASRGCTMSQSILRYSRSRDSLSAIITRNREGSVGWLRVSGSPCSIERSISRTITHCCQFAINSKLLRLLRSL